MTKKTSPKDKAMRELPLKPDQAGHVKGGASDIFAKIGDIKGESLDSKHKDEIAFRRR
jgi:hypothetical protein